MKLFVRLNASTRSSRLRVSPKLISRDSAMSMVQNPEPSTAFRSRLPNVPGAGLANAARFRSFVRLFVP